MIAQRQVPRVAWLLEARVYVPENNVYWKLRLADINTSGCFVETLLPLEPTSHVLVTIHHGNLRLKLPGVIQYGLYGIDSAIKFAPLDPKTRASLLEIIQSRKA